MGRREKKGGHHAREGFNYALKTFLGTGGVGGGTKDKRTVGNYRRVQGEGIHQPFSKKRYSLGGKRTPN